jgi:hypothetical protein
MTDVRELSAENTLIHLAIHCIKDNSFYNHHLLDTYLLLTKKDLNIERAFAIFLNGMLPVVCTFN